MSKKIFKKRKIKVYISKNLLYLDLFFYIYKLQINYKEDFLYMGNNKCVLRLDKLHTFPQLHALQKHNDRLIKLPNIDKDKTYENKHLLSYGANSYTDTWHEIIKKHELISNKKIPVRKNAVLALEIVTSYSKDADVDVQAWAKANLEWMKKTFGEENIIACTLHMDETTPHIHTEIVPIDERNRLCAKTFTAGRKAMSNLQSSYGKAMEEFGLKRGDVASKSKKKSLKKFYTSVNNASTAKLPPQMSNEEDEEYLKRMEEYCQTMKLAMENLKIQLEQAYADGNTKIAQEFSKFTTAVSLYEDLLEKFDGNEDDVNERITIYRRIENMVPKNTLGTLLNNLVDKFKSNETPLTNWAHFGNNAIFKKKKKEEGGLYQTIENPINESNNSSAQDDFEMYKNAMLDD